MVRLGWFCIVIVGLLTASAPNSAMAYEVNVSERGARIRWANETVALRLDPKFEAMLAPGESYAGVIMALEAWRGLANVPDLIVKSGEPKAPGHHGDGASNSVHLLDHWDYEPEKLAITVVTYELTTGRLLDADILVNPEVEFALLSETGKDKRNDSHYDLAAVLTHEIGHVLGLGETDADPMATMWPYTDVGLTHQRSLTDDDEQGVISAYEGTVPDAPAGCGAMTVSGRLGNRPGPGWLWLLLVAAGVLLYRRRPRGKGQIMWAAGVGVLVAGSPVEDAGPKLVDSLDPLAEISQARPTDASRLAHLMGDGGERHEGRVTRLETAMRDGLLHTGYEIVNSQGQRVSFELPGGEQDGIGQIVGHNAPPRDGDEVMVVPQARGGVHWAHHHGGQLHGGDLGPGPAISF